MQFNPGTGGTLKSTTAEDAFVELLILMKNAEETEQTTNANFQTRLTISLSMSEKTVTFNGSLTATVVNGSDGRPVINVNEYIGVAG